MDFLLQDGNHDHLPAGKGSFDSTEYGRWMAKIFDCYLADASPVPIRVLDDTMKLCLGGSGTKEGMGEDQYNILIIETDGGIRKNDTLRTSHEGADRFSESWNVNTTSLADVLSAAEFQHYSQLQLPRSPICQSCDLLTICGGGMPLYRWSSARGYDNPSVYCQDHQLLIRHIRARLSQERLLVAPEAGPCI